MIGKAAIIGWLTSTVVLALASSATGQMAPPAPSSLPMPVQSLTWPSASLSSDPTVSAPRDGAQRLLDFQESDIKFSLQSLMEILRDHRHEGWVLAAYPDPNTGRPLIGAGFSLDVPATEHRQTDPLNPHLFVEPSSAQLWQAAGLAPEQLQEIMDRYDRDRAEWSLRTFRHKIVRHKLTPQLTEEEATRLLRISALQAIYNARAYCRGFDQLTGPQQMALTQLVFQMGTNLEQFVQFLNALNDENNARELAQLDGYLETYPEHWQTVENTLIESQWARRYSVRATSVIAMFDPEYGVQPNSAEQRVEAVLHPPEKQHSQRRPTPTPRTASYNRHSGRGRHKKQASSRSKRKLA